MAYLPHSDKPCKDCACFDSHDALANKGMIVTVGMGHCKNDPAWCFKSPFTTCGRFSRHK